MASEACTMFGVNDGRKPRRRSKTFLSREQDVDHEAVEGSISRRRTVAHESIQGQAERTELEGGWSRDVQV